jgi:hypothetical protein
MGIVGKMPSYPHRKFLPEPLLPVLYSKTIPEEEFRAGLKGA